MTTIPAYQIDDMERERRIREYEDRELARIPLHPYEPANDRPVPSVREEREVIYVP